MGASPDCRITPPANPTYGSRSFRYSRSLFIISPSLPSFRLSLRHSGESRNPEDHLKRPFVSIPASRRNGTPSIGVISNLDQSIEQYREDAVAGFIRRYGVHTLVRYEGHATLESAIVREKVLKRWRRAWKVESIEKRKSFVAGSVGGGRLTGFRLSPE